MGPLTHCHLCFALFSLTWVFVQTVSIRFCMLSVALVQMPVHALICSAGILTHRMTEVAQVPAAISSVARAMLALATLMLEGAMPTAVHP